MSPAIDPLEVWRMGHQAFFALTQGLVVHAHLASEAIAQFHAAGAVFARYLLREPPTVGEVLASVEGTEEGRVLRRFFEESPMQIMKPLIESDVLRGAAVAQVIDPHGLHTPGVFFAYSAGTKINQFADARHAGNPTHRAVGHGVTAVRGRRWAGRPGDRGRASRGSRSRWCSR